MYCRRSLLLSALSGCSFHVVNSQNSTANQVSAYTVPPGFPTDLFSAYYIPPSPTQQVRRCAGLNEAWIVDTDFTSLNLLSMMLLLTTPIP